MSLVRNALARSETGENIAFHSRVKVKKSTHRQQYLKRRREEKWRGVGEMGRLAEVRRGSTGEADGEAMASNPLVPS